MPARIRSRDEAITELEALVGIIQESIQSIKETITSKNILFPSPHTPVTEESEAVRMIPTISQACSSIVSAANQLVSSVRSPTQSAVITSMQVSAQSEYACLSSWPLHSIHCHWQWRLQWVQMSRSFSVRLDLRYGVYPCTVLIDPVQYYITGGARKRYCTCH